MFYLSYHEYNHKHLLITFLLFQVEWQSNLYYYLFVFLFGLFLDIRYTGAVAPMTSAIVLPELRTTGFALIQTMYALAFALASFVIGKLGVEIGLTKTFLYATTGAAAINALVWFVFYPIFHRDATRIQTQLANRVEVSEVQA